MKILAIDPGTTDSAYVLLDKDLKPVEFGKVGNDELLVKIFQLCSYHYVRRVAIEMIASYGLAVGKEVFETCVWIGRFYQEACRSGVEPVFIYRTDEKMNLCGSMKAKDTNIRTALVDRFAKHDFKNGKGTKNNRDIFYGFSKDVWAAMAIGVTYYDMHVK